MTELEQLAEDYRKAVLAHRAARDKVGAAGQKVRVAAKALLDHCKPPRLPGTRVGTGKYRPSTKPPR